MAEQIVENLPVGVIVVDRDMRIVQLNPAAREIAECAAADATGRHLSELLEPALWAEANALQQAIQTGRPVQPRMAGGRRSAATSDGHADSPEQRRLWIAAAPIDRGYLFSLQDVRPLCTIDAERVSDLSHDVRSPLASIRAYTELLVDEVDRGRPELRRQFLDVIDERSRHLTDVIVNLTGLVRWKLGYFPVIKGCVSLGDVAREAIASFQVQARQQEIRLLLDATDARHPVAADRDALFMLLRNLISNAVKFSNAGGRVVVSLRCVGEDQIVKVTDSGSGIPPKDMPHVFEMFYRGRNAIAAGLEGSGLGLALARVIVGAHEGRIDVASEEGRGTTVTVALPAADAPQSQA